MREPSASTQTRWPDGARLALSIVVNVEEGSESNVRDGDPVPDPVDELGISLRKPVRNYGNESNYLYGIKEGFPRIRDLLVQHDINATWTAAALALERAPQIAGFIREAKHETCSHGWRWMHQFRMDEKAERDFIRRAVDSIERTTGERPVGWLSRYLHTERTRRLLLQEGFQYHMDDYSGDEPFWAQVDCGKKGFSPMVIVPYALDSNDMKMWTDPAMTPAQWLDYAVRTFDCLYAEAADRSRTRMMSLGLHLRIIGRPGRIWALRDFLEHVAGHTEVWFATRREIAALFAEQNPAPTATDS